MNWKEAKERGEVLYQRHKPLFQNIDSSRGRGAKESEGGRKNMEEGKERKRRHTFRATQVV